MKTKLTRFAAMLMLVVPGVAATYGFLTMKDALFAFVDPAPGSTMRIWGKFAIGLLLFAIGVSFIGGWIFFRDRKRNYVAPRFKQKRSRGPRGG